MALFAAGVVAPLAPPAWAQISPGPLARAHAALEGSGQCLRCHDAARGVSAEKCLGCHKPLAERIAAGRGLHARPEYRDCKTCHVEHQGADVDLVFWGRAGRAGFDHRQTGYALEGKHVELDCQRCHRPEHKGYLGAISSCATCHKDVHRAQFAGRDCGACHSQTGWKPAAGFSHARTDYPLTGRHASVACDKCHPPLAPAAPDAGAAVVALRYKGVSRDCAACHQDAHQGRLGTGCASCHTPESWRQRLAGARIDHDRTAYPLRGRHVGVACEACHRPGRPLRMPHALCSDCHQDAHLGQLARRPDKGRCEACHDVSGFAPARFGPEEHARTAYPLLGAHLAVPCDACHRRVAPDALRRQGLAAGAGAAERPTPQLRFARTRCADCHRDPHKGELDRYVGKGGCEACHRVESWRQVGFDHAQTRFALSGAHERAACAKCHTAADAGTPRERQRFTGLPLLCDGCHKDPHQGQLARAGAPSCERCHTTADWKPTRFDHARDSAYALDGAHARVACAKCHPAEERGGARSVRYKPRPTTCLGCHGPAARPGSAKPVERKGTP